uniref:PIEZO domain-containing protein n=1 Tax=Globodera pallida TaxID=36090 RepID=A0A183C0X8_GLOPA
MNQFGSATNANANANNPYAQFRCFCTALNTKDHAQLCGVLSFTLFLCLVVISMVVFGSLSMFYIVVGVVVYSLLMKSLFGVVNKLSILFYLLFETIQIGFYLALLLYIVFPLLFFHIPRRNCYSAADINNGTLRFSEICDEPQNHFEDYVELLLFVTLIASIKLHFARVFAHFFKYLTWNEQSLLHRAQYINGRGIHITMERQFPSFPPNFDWDTHTVKDDAFGRNTNNLAQLHPMELPPTYAQVIGQQKKGEGRGGPIELS